MHKPKILTVDDRLDNLIALEEVLDDFDVEFVRALSGNEAVARSIRSEFALILMDVQMPGMDGFEAVRLIHKDKTNKNTPVIFVSAIYSEDFYKIKGVKSGGVDFITKPVVDDILIGKVKIFLQLYEQKMQLQEKINETRALVVKTREAGYAKSIFLTNVSHEFRTPMNCILALSKKLTDNAEGNLTDEQVEFISTIHSAGRDLMSMVNDILEVAQIETARMKAKVEALDLQSFMEKIKNQYKPMADAKNLSWQVEIEDGAPVSIETDYHRFMQIMRKLLNNAFKFTLEGGVSLRINRPGSGPELSHPEYTVAISVADTGVGISGDNFEEIFEVFSQVDGSSTRRFGGMGLGLSVCRIFASFLGGNIQVESTEGKGSVFTLYLPRQLNIPPAGRHNDSESASACPINDKESAARKSSLLKQREEEKEPVCKLQEASSCEDADFLRGKKILLVEDDERIIRIFKRLLIKEGMEVLVGTNGQQGLDTLIEHPDIDLVLMDMMMPVMDGYTAMTKIRSQDTTICDVPIIAVTAKAMNEDRQKCIQAGACDYLTKPVDLDELLIKIRELIIADRARIASLKS